MEKGGEYAEYYTKAIQLCTSAALPMVLYTAMKLNLFEIMAKSGHHEKLTPTQIAAKLPTKNPNAASMLDRMLHLLSNYDVFTCDVVEDAREDGTVRYERIYGLSPLGKFFLPDSEGHTIGHLAELVQDKIFIGSWYGLGDAILEGGKAFEIIYGEHQFEYSVKDQRFNEVFNKGLAGLTSTTIRYFLQEYEGFEGIKTLVDVGGGLGITIHKIVSKYPQIQGINFDLPHVVKDAPPYPGVTHIGGDMFESVPKADAIFIKGVIHDWTDDYCLKLLKNCFKALPENGKVIVVDFILPLKSDGSAYAKTVCQTDTLMMTVTPGGRERSEFEFQALAVGAGFKGVRAKRYVGDIGVIEMYK
ncbi:OLC1v1037690C1 [Oldenlandia corymbosa var. corymbosa]|uniref:OLC1v1037690C1 n=1 Tax=Oldenlandia corymbosa var. corymbosa TaxID=529605 RepID=A0AAV1CXZ0_OLDCO|nr:OLC1v1037690C1 [Oldenlandia corymbosa var. corymbosa]